MQINRVGSMFTLFFTDAPVTDYASAKRADTDRYARFFRAMLDRGVYLPPSQFESCFVSLAHMERDITQRWKRRSRRSASYCRKMRSVRTELQFCP